MTIWAAALTYYGLLSLFPALIALMSIVGLSAIRSRRPGPHADRHPARAGLGGGHVRRADRVDHVEPRRPPASCSSSAWRCALVGVGLRRRVHAGRQRDLGDAGGPAVLEAAPAADPRHAGDDRAARRSCCSASCSPARSSARSRGRSGIGSTAQTVWNIAKWPVMLVVVMLMFAVLFHAAPEREAARLQVGQPGRVLRASCCGSSRPRCSRSTSPTSAPTTRPTARSAASSGCSCGCGSPTSPCCSGMELNAERERSRELAAGVPRADREIQLEPRALRSNSARPDKRTRALAPAGRRPPSEPARRSRCASSERCSWRSPPTSGTCARPSSLSTSGFARSRPR